MKAVVTGGAGFIGSHLVDRLLADDWEVVVIDDYSTHAVARPLPVPTITDRVQNVHLPALGFDAVFHLASKVGPTGVLGFAGRIAQDTIDAAMRAGQWALEAGCPLIDVSTSEVYGGGQDGLCIEHMRRVIPAGHSARMEYAVGKLAAETALLNTVGLDVRIVRPFNVAGPGQRIDGGFVLPRFVAQALRNEPLTVYRPGTQRRAFTHVSDIVDGLMLTLQRGIPGEVYNLGNPDNLCTIRQLAQEVIAATRSHAGMIMVDPQTLHGPLFREAPDKYPDAEKAMKALGWKPRKSRADVIADVIAYERHALVA